MLPYTERRGADDGLEGYYDGKSFSKRPKEQFVADCAALEKDFAHLVEFLDPFFLVAPDIRFDADEKRLVIGSGLRPLGVAKHKTGHVEVRRELARKVVEAHWPDEPALHLIPRAGKSVFAGIGTMVCLVFRELFRASISNLTVHTTSMEIATFLYLRHQGTGIETGGLRLGEALVVDRGEGSMQPAGRDGSDIDVAVISCHAVKDGRLWTDASETTVKQNEKLLKRAKRIAVVVEREKFDMAGGRRPFNLPKREGGRIVLVTNAAATDAVKHLPGGIVPLCV